MQRDLVFAGLAGLAVVVAAHLGISERLGAHPVWAVTTGHAGAAAGAVAGLVLSRVRSGPVLVVGVLVAGLGLWAAKVGAARFAASYAENALAGRVWLFGWIGVAAGGVLIVHAALRSAFGAAR